VIVALLYDLGLRANELCELEVDLEAHYREHAEKAARELLSDVIDLFVLR